MGGESLKLRFLNSLYRCFPFDLIGDCAVSPKSCGIRISCIINFYGRLDLLSGILNSLASQNYQRELFEVILVEDRGGTDAGRKLAEEFSSIIQIRYLPLEKCFGLMGYSRNFGLAESRGEYILFLDDDTVILQDMFLAKLFDIFDNSPDTDAVVPRGSASFAVINGRYDYHDPFFMTSRCTAYRRSILAELGGFVDDFIGQEDVEFVIRFSIAGKRARNVHDLHYYHPPLLINSLRKPMAVGQSFFRLKKRYPIVVWLIILLNCSRHVIYCLLPYGRFQHMGRFGLGFMLGVVSGFRNKKGLQYG